MHMCLNIEEENWMIKVKKCIFIGYNEQSKAYKLYNPITKKTIIRRDVVFKE